MSNGRIAELASRGVVAVSGPDAAAFLDNLFTTDVSKAGDGRAVYGGLLTPQGKILFDFIVFADGERYLIDIGARARRRPGQAPRLLQAPRQGRDRGPLRRADRGRGMGRRLPRRSSTVRWRPIHASPLSATAPSCRPAPIWRPTTPRRRKPTTTPTASLSAFRRAASTSPIGDAFPHDADMDQLDGVDFKQGLLRRPGGGVADGAPRHGAAPDRVIARGDATSRRGATVTAGDKPVGTSARRTAISASPSSGSTGPGRRWMPACR